MREVCKWEGVLKKFGRSRIYQGCIKWCTKDVLRVYRQVIKTIPVVAAVMIAKAVNHVYMIPIEL